MDNYRQILARVLDKIPFPEFRKRMVGFINNPILDNSYACSTQLQYSGVDIFNALGFLSIACVLLALVDKSWSVFKTISVFNPVHTVAIYIANGIVYAVTLSLVFTAWHCLRVGNVNYYKDISYKIFSHGLRIYALYGFLLGFLFIKSYGDLLLRGLFPEQSFSHLGWMIYILIVLVWWPFRLLVNPIFNLMGFKRFRKTAWLFTACFCFASFQPIKLIVIGSSNKMINFEQQCKVFKSGEFYKGLNGSAKEEAEVYFCKTT
ncbi:hypothetical protein ACODG7_02070 [Vibrio anguillarum]|uniref:hypothetical protein n=1 Tax=Vibrio anguillarum TaxID=55601 RepID=UPI0002EAFC0D|nr:hypothetical protein [Vibrio anguillarum]OEE31734.1 hypothetical protein A1QW_12255 [Vibrio anguillarum]OEF88560.1 hypothetical protein A1QY_12385 [Vibrio anguillarum]